jgi:DNA-binding CsgD family transcriptional regulator
VGEKLTEMEAMCVRYTMEGLQNAEIAQRMDISDHAVKSALQRAYVRLGVTNCSAPRTRAAVMMISADMETHAGRLLRTEER